MSVKASSQVSMLDITDAYSVTLTSEAFAFVGNTSGAPSGLSCATQVVAYCGTQRCSKVTIGTVSCPSGISASISNNGSNAPTITFTTTATITAACEATIPVTVDGVTINKKFSFAVAKQGAQGDAGNDGRNATYITVSGTNYDAINGINKNYSYISINGTKYDFNPGRGHTLAIINPSNGAVESIQSYDTYYSPELLDSPLNNVEAGKIICLFTADASALSQMSRNILIECGSSMTDTWGQTRVTHVFIGMKGLSRGNAYEWFGSGDYATKAITAYYTPSGIVLNGRVGDTGNGVSSSTVDYQVSSSGTTIPTGTWQPSVPSVSPGQYLWTRTILKYTNGSSSSASYSVGRMGTNGTDGSNGRGIKSTVVTYQAGSSGTSAPTGTWTSSVPATTAAAPYLWSKTVITYTDNNAPSTTYSVGSTPEGIVVGGRNLIRNTATMNGTFNIDASGYGTLGTVAYQSDGSALVTNSNSNFRFSVKNDLSVAAGEVYTISAYYKDVSGIQAHQFQIMDYTNNKIVIENLGIKETLSDGWIKSYCTFTIPNGCSRIHAFFRSGQDFKAYTHSYYIKHPKLEKGNKATDWTPAPEDTEAEISALSTRVTNAETSITKSNEAIELRATKTEVANTYATKTDVNNIQVGGRNLIRGSHKTEVTYTYPGSGLIDKFSGTSTVPLNAGTYTLSFWAKSTVNGDKVRVHLYYPSNITWFINSQGVEGPARDGCCDFTLTTTMTKYWVTYTVPKDNSTRIFIVPRIGIGHGVSVTGSGTLTFKWEKLEEGNKATDWTPAPEDTEAEISALSTRVINAETSITENNEAIQLRAIKTEVANTYATKTDVNNIQVGGRNLIQKSAIMPGVFRSDNSGASAMGTVAYQSDGSALVTNSNSNFRFTGPEFNVTAGEVYTISAYYKEVSGTQTHQFQITYNAGILGGTTAGVGTKQNIGDGWIKSYYTFIIPTGCTKIRIWLRSGEDYKLYTHSYYVKHPKFEKGNKATDWTPAPEDLETRVTTAESKIDQTATKISLVVKSGDSESNMVLTDKVCQLVANNINLNGRVTISGLDYDAQTKINNGNDAYNWKTSGEGSSLLSMVKKWTNNSVSDTTTIQGGWIATNTITANKIAIGDFTNYCTVNANVPETMLPTSFFLGGTKVIGPSATGGLAFAKASNSQQYLAFCDYTPFLFKPGEQLYFYGNIPNWSSTDCSAGIYMWLYDTNKNYLSNYAFWQGTLTRTTWNKVSGNITITNIFMQQVKYFLIGIDTGTTGHMIGAADLICKKKTTGELIVDGSITAAKIAANAITADKIAAGSITAAKIAAGAITADKIAAGAITADKLAANAITADKLAANAITGKTISGGSININDKFQVDTSGNLAASGGIYLRKLSIDESGLNTYIQSFHDGLVCNIYMKAAGKVAVISASESHYVGCVASCDGFNITGTTHANAILPESNATYALGEGGSKGWSNIYIGNASNTYNGLRIINGTTNYNLCGINSSNTMIFGDPSWEPYIYVKNTSTPPSGAVQSFTIGDNGSTNINDAHVWLYGRNDTTSRYIGSYLVYARTYGSAANVVVTANGVLGRSTSSSKRYKHDIREFSVDEVSCLYDLPLKKFKYNNDYISKDDEYYDKDLYGFIVEDLDEVLPISVQHNLDNDAEYTIPEMWNNNIIVPCLLKLIQDLNNRLKKVEEGKEN